MLVVSVIDTIDDSVNVETASIVERCGVKALVEVIRNFKSDGINEYDEMVKALHGRGSYNYAPKNLELDLENRTKPPTKPSIEETPSLELKAFQSHLQYAFLGANYTLLVIIMEYLVESHVEALILVLQRFKIAIGWSTTNIMGTPPGICTHKIQLEPECIPNIEH